MKPVYVDTNVFIRFFIKDIADQFEQAKAFFLEVEEGRQVGYISLLVINEIIWIMEHFYHLKRSVYLPKLMKLLSLKNMRCAEVKKNDLLNTLQNVQSTSYDFTDLHLWSIAKGERIFSFDQDFTKMKSNDL